MLTLLPKRTTLPVPGPFACFAGRDGVDETFDVFCLTTEDHVVSTYFWEAREACRVVTEVVTFALNRFAGHDIDDSFDSKDIVNFRHEYSGPYSIRKNRCEGRGPCFEVYCRSTNRGIVDRYGRSRFDRQIAKAIARSLNRLLSST